MSRKISSVSKAKNQANGRNPTQSKRQLQQSSFGMWRNRQDMDENWLANGRARWKSDWAGKRKT